MGTIGGGDGAIYNGDHMQVVGRFAGPQHPMALSDDEIVRVNFGSYHQGVCHFVFGDGAVHPLDVSMDLKVYEALGTRAGGEPISSGVLE